MHEYLYYLTLPFVVVGASITSCYVLYPNKTKSYLMNMSWKLTKLVVECNDIKEDLDKKLNLIKGNIFDKNNLSDSNSETSDVNEYNEVIIYNTTFKRGFSNTIETFNNNTNIINNENFRVMFYHKLENDNEFYKRIDRVEHLEQLQKEDDLHIKTIEKQFIQVEYITKDDNNDEKIIDIHSNLGDFYIKGNIILDKYFLEWYLEAFYDIEIADNYKLRFFDKDVNMFTLTTNNAIIFGNNTYSKIDIDDDIFIINDETYEGAESDQTED
jgi:hypothetical protein